MVHKVLKRSPNGGESRNPNRIEEGIQPAKVRKTVYYRVQRDRDDA